MGDSASEPSVAAPTQHSARFAVVVPATSKLLQAAQQKALHSHSDTLQANDNGPLATRVTALEKKHHKLEKMVRDIGDKINKLGL